MRNGRHRKRDMQYFQIAPGLFCCRHVLLTREGERESKARCQKFSENSGMLTMYFRFSVQRNTIFNGSDSISSIRFAITM